ncbi:TonB-dependent receptor [Gilvimarinus xylanilyticus]|uniref:TonB-dependent receptor n=1 Tax=Gilvimarinus xylanilyticus TaxID=2944139 RepID=A0A9X2KV12_9GAMM|nr:TonB-dependent receptor [Gilvimarinus xylanilyticus]MCP8900929.1 TonB-dependent receptor [Gilvimarinus xylanilyticus]
MKVSHVLSKKRLAACVSAIAVGGTALPALAQLDTPQLEEVVVTGVRAAQQNSVNIKRDADSVVDAISAEDIGKLPDVTITDSLQRISGVQIRRNAGEGTALNIRGLPQVLTTLNGESYLGANSITTVQPNYSDIPSQLFSGAEVAKSQTASMNAGGITGIVDLQTYRPFDFDEGFTVSGAVNGTYGMDTEETDPSANLLLNWNSERIGVMAAVSRQEATLANYYSGVMGDGGWTGFTNETDYGWVSPDNDQFADRYTDGAVDINNDGDLDDRYWAYVGHTAYNRETERERTGANLAVQVDLGAGFEFVAEALVTDLEDNDYQVGIANSDKWQSWSWYDATQSTDHGSVNTVQEYTTSGRRIKSYSSVQAQTAESQNYNIELNYDNGGEFTGSFRYIRGEAEQERLNSYTDVDLANGSQWGVECQYYPDGTAGEQGDCADGQLQTNPGGYLGYPQLSIDYSGDDPRWSGFDNNANLSINGDSVGEARSIADYMGDVNSYALGAFASENNFSREGELDVARFDGEYRFDTNFFTSVEFGVRYSERSVDNFEFDLLSPVNGCDVKWKATDVIMDGGGVDGACVAGDGENYYAAGVPTPLADLDPIQVSDFGSVSGVPSIWAVDPRAMADVEAYHEALYPGTHRSIFPGRSYEVELEELSYYAKANFETGIMSGNFGLRAIDSDLTVVQNEVGAAQAYGAAAVDAGDITTERSLDYLLPSLNLRFDLSEDLILRASYARTMAPLDLAQWGGGLSPNYVLDSNPDSDTYNQFIVSGGNANGNPELDPWEATNYDLSLEYYMGGASSLSVGWFYIDVESFIESGTVQMELPDQDGVVRRSVPISTSIQGDGGVLKGVELAAKLAFDDFLDVPMLSGFGVDANYTYSPSESGNQGMDGQELPFQDNSEDVINLVGWYENGPLQARLAYNYRSERVAGFNQTWGEGTLWQEPTAYVDASVSYDINDYVSVFLNASNITEEKETYYLEYEDQFAWQNEYEARYTMGVRATF